MLFRPLFFLVLMFIVWLRWSSCDFCFGLVVFLSLLPVSVRFVTGYLFGDGRSVSTCGFFIGFSFWFVIGGFLTSSWCFFLSLVVDRVVRRDCVWDVFLP